MEIRYRFTLHCIKYARIRVFTNPCSSADSVLTREKTVIENPYSCMYYAVLARVLQKRIRLDFPGMRNIL